MIIKSTCPRDCYDTCSILTTVEDGKVVKLEGNPAHPVTQGFICWKIKNSPKFVYSPDRLLYPMRRVGPKGVAKFERISWDEAFSEIAARFGGIIQKHGPEAILPFHYFGHMGLLTTHAAQRIFNALGTGKCSQTVCSMAGRMALKYVYGSYWGVDPEDMTAEERLREIAAILALGLLRLTSRGRELAGGPADPSTSADKRLDVPGQPSGSLAERLTGGDTDSAEAPE